MHATTRRRTPIPPAMVGARLFTVIGMSALASACLLILTTL